MNKIISLLKTNKIQLPVWAGQVMSYIPYSVRPIVGKSYRKGKKEINEYAKMSASERQTYVFNKMHQIVDYAINNIDFYRDFYKQKGFNISMLKSFEDINKIPIITKKDFYDFPIEKRTNMKVPKFLVNTGGSSGYTLSFYVHPYQIGHEWVHIHQMWSLLGFKQSDLQLFMIGRSVVKNGVDYEFARHCLSVDIYKPFEETAPALINQLKKHPCYYLHGYPSVLSEFAEYCGNNLTLLNLLKGRLRGAFLNSEYPYSLYRDKIEHMFDVPTQSFYGHTERCVMAYELNTKNRYTTFQTYGYAEAIPNGDGHFDLVGTSYNNFASPLIRYNTKDVIDNPEYENGLLEKFDILEGRSGQFIIDKNNRPVSLTGLIMGRHHEIFDKVSHIQITQKEQGKAIVLFVPLENMEINNPGELFDSSNVDIVFEFKKLSSPIRTGSGKVLLLVSPELFEATINNTNL